MEEHLRGTRRVVHRAFGTGGHQVDVAVGHPTARLIGHEPSALGRDLDLIAHCCVRAQQFGTDHNGNRLDQGQAVYQRPLSLRRVEHGADAAQLGHGQHVEQQLGAILDKQRHHVPLADALGLQVMGNTIGALIGVSVADHAVPIQQGSTLRVTQRGLFEMPAQAAGLAGVGDVGSTHAAHHPW